jgi:hypothetical protein
LLPFLAPVLSLGRDISSRNNSSTRVNEEKRENLAVTRLRVIREREGRDSVLQCVRKHQKASFTAGYRSQVLSYLFVDEAAGTGLKTEYTQELELALFITKVIEMSVIGTVTEGEGVVSDVLRVIIVNRYSTNPLVLILVNSLYVPWTDLPYQLSFNVPGAPFILWFLRRKLDVSHLDNYLQSFLCKH